MSSDRLLEARGLEKTYSMSLSPSERFFEAIFGWKPDKPHHTVLSDITLDVFRGETLGVMGRNGAGKTTLLGILGDVIEPSRGKVTRYGTVAVLLAVGAGFNPQFTGRENAELFCSLMGFGRSEFGDRIALIAAFADLGDYFDMPLRTYSSGMLARLGFSCAIHVDADVIIIDETLAVGDASFRVKCYQRIKAMQGRGQTFLLVSHSPNLIANFCTRTIVLEKGRMVFEGPPLDGLNYYKDVREGIASGKRPAAAKASALTAGKLGLEAVRFTALDGKERFRLTGELVAHESVDQPVVSFGIRNQEGIVLCSFETGQALSRIEPMAAGDRRRLTLEFENRLLDGQFFISARLAERVGDVTSTLGMNHDIARFEVVRRHSNKGMVNLEMTVTTESLIDADGAGG